MNFINIIRLIITGIFLLISTHSLADTSPKSLAGTTIKCSSINNSTKLEFTLVEAVPTSNWSLDQWYQAKTLDSSNFIFYVLAARLSRYPRRAAGLSFTAAFGSNRIDHIDLENITYTTMPNEIPLGFRGQLTKSRYLNQARQVDDVICQYVTVQ